MKKVFIKSIVFWCGIYIISIGLQRSYICFNYENISLIIAGLLIIYGRWNANKKLSI